MKDADLEKVILEQIVDSVWAAPPEFFNRHVASLKRVSLLSPRIRSEILKSVLNRQTDPNSEENVFAPAIVC